MILFLFCSLGGGNNFTMAITGLLILSFIFNNTNILKPKVDQPLCIYVDVNVLRTCMMA